MIPFNWCYKKVDIPTIETITFADYNGWSNLFIIDISEDWWDLPAFKDNSNWLKFKEQLEAEEELWFFKSPAIATTRIKGIAAVKDNNVSRYIII